MKFVVSRSARRNSDDSCTEDTALGEFHIVDDADFGLPSSFPFDNLVRDPIEEQQLESELSTLLLSDDDALEYEMKSKAGRHQILIGKKQELLLKLCEYASGKSVLIGQSRQQLLPGAKENTWKILCETFSTQLEELNQCLSGYKSPQYPSVFDDQALLRDIDFMMTSQYTVLEGKHLVTHRAQDLLACYECTHESPNIARIKLLSPQLEILTALAQASSIQAEKEQITARLDALSDVLNQYAEQAGLHEIKTGEVIRDSLNARKKELMKKLEEKESKYHFLIMPGRSESKVSYDDLEKAALEVQKLEENLQSLLKKIESQEKDLKEYVDVIQPVMRLPNPTSFRNTP